MPLRKLISQTTDQRAHVRRHQLKQGLLRKGAKLGGTLFGPIPRGHRREFFCLDKHTWVWYEEWKDNTGSTKSLTTRYDVRPSGIIKIQEGQPNTYVSLEEARNLQHAAHQYRQKFDAEFAQFI